MEDVCTLVTDGTHDTPNVVPEGFPLIKGKDISNGYIDFENCDRITEEEHRHIMKRSKPERGDVLFANIGNSIGDCVYVDTDREFSIKNVALFKPDVDAIDPRFLYYVATGEQFIGEILSEKSGAAQPFVSLAMLRRHKVVVPPLPTQQKIAHTLSAYDDLIENNLKRIKLLEEMAQITYEQWFVRMKFPGHETTPIDAETGLPEGWEELAISELCVVNGSSITNKNAPKSIQYIDIASVNTGDYELPKSMSFATAPSRARRKVKFGDTIFSTVRPNRKIYSLILVHTSALVASTGFATLTPKISDTHSFVYLSVANQSFVDRAVAFAGGAAYPAVNQSDFEKITITFPGEELIQKFSEIYNQYFDLVGNLKRQNIHLKEARDILLPRLMTGMIDVDHIELPDIPVS